MNMADALRHVRRPFLDTAPVIYLVERNPKYTSVITSIFSLIEQGAIPVVTSLITLAECLVGPKRRGLAQLERDFRNRIVSGVSTTFKEIDEHDAQVAADLRGRYNLALTDALQAAIALNTGCDALLTNDTDLERLVELSVLVIDKLDV